MLAIPLNREDTGASPGEAESSAKPARLITLDQIEREHVIQEAYSDFRGALKNAEVLALVEEE